jgi:RNA polymerase sigma-70 factor, ECF subfamily
MNSSVGMPVAEQDLAARMALDRDDFARVFDEYYPAIYNYMYYRLRDTHAASELAADVFEQVLRSIDRYRPERGPLAGWIYGIARRLVINHLRRRRFRWLSLDHLRDRDSKEPSPDELVAVREQERKLLEALGTLKEREQDLLALKFAGQLSNREIAALTGLSESNVAVIIYRAVQRLRTVLKEYGGEHE